MSSRASQDPEVQLVRLRARADIDGCSVYQEYIDRASGANPDRPALNRMLGDARGHRFSRIYVVRLDRLMRSTRHLLEIVEMLRVPKVRLVCLDQDIDIYSNMGRLMTAMLGAIAEYERDIMRDRVLDGLAKTRAKGTVLGRKPLVIDMEAAVKMHEDGVSPLRIAEALGVSKSTIKRRFKNMGEIS